MEDHSEYQHISAAKPAAVDVVIPVYNGQKFIVQALSSVVQQTYSPQKIVVVDDGSTDDTESLVKRFKSSIPLEYVRKSNGGPSSARNVGIARCTAEFIAFLDADDEWYPNKLAEQLRVAYDTEFHNLGVVYCRYTIIDDNGDLTDEHYIYEPEVTARGNVYSLLLETNKIAASDSGVLVRRDCFEKVGGFDETLSAYEDWDMWLRLAEQYEFDLSNAALVKIRRHAKSIQHRMSHMLDNQLRFYQKWLVRLPSDAACYSRWRLDIAYRVIAAWKDRASLGLVKKILSQENRRTLFSPTFGSFFLYLLGAMPLIAIRFLIKRTNHPIKVLRRKEGRVISSEGKGTDHV